MTVNTVHTSRLLLRWVALLRRLASLLGEDSSLEKGRVVEGRLAESKLVEGFQL